MTCKPCPVCGAPYGFHDEEPHAEAAARIPRELILPTSTSEKEAARQAKHENYLRWLAQQAATDTPS